MHYENHRRTDFKLIVEFYSETMGSNNKLKQRDSTNQQKSAQASLSVNERILKECHQLYMDPDNGLVEVCFMNFVILHLRNSRKSEKYV